MAKRMDKGRMGARHLFPGGMKRRLASGLLAATLVVTGVAGAGPLAGGMRTVRADEDAKVQGVISKVSGVMAAISWSKAQ